MNLWSPFIDWHYPILPPFLGKGEGLLRNESLHELPGFALHSARLSAFPYTGERP